MQRKFKGFAPEDLLASIFAALLTIVFIFSIVSAYGNYFRNVDRAEQSHTALVLAEKIFFDNNGIITDPGKISVDANNTKTIIVNTGLQKTYTSGSIEGYSTVFSSSLPIMIHNITEGRLYPARLEVYVGK